MPTPKNNTVVVLLFILTVVAVGMVLKTAQAVIRPLVIAWLLSYIFGPVVNYLTERKVPLPMIVTPIIVFLMMVCYMGGVFLLGRIESFVDAFPAYNERLMALLAERTADWDWNPLEGIVWGETITKSLGTNPVICEALFRIKSLIRTSASSKNSTTSACLPSMRLLPTLRLGSLNLASQWNSWMRRSMRRIFSAAARARG